MKLSCIISVAADNHQWLDRAIDSAVGHFDEIIVVADYHIANLHVLQENPNLTTVVTTTSPGIAPAKNLGISIATGDYVSILDSDDWYIKEGLLKITNVIKYANEHHSRLYFGNVCEFEQVDEEMHYLNRWPNGTVDIKSSSIPCSSFFDRKLWYAVEGLEHVRYDDWHFWKKLASYATQHWIDCDFYGHRRWPGSASAKIGYNSSLEHTPL